MHTSYGKKEEYPSYIASKNRKSESSNSSIWEELKFESNKFIISGMDKGNRKKRQQIRIRYKKIIDID